MACGDRPFDGPTPEGPSPRERAAASQSARTFAQLYFGPLDRAEATRADLRRLRAVTASDVYNELAESHRRAAQKRRESEYARRKLNARQRCDIGDIRITPRAVDRVLAEPVIRCGDRVVGWGFELVRRRSRWVVGDLRDARFDRQGRCIAESCRAS